MLTEAVEFALARLLYFLSPLCQPFCPSHWQLFSSLICHFPPLLVNLSCQIIRSQHRNNKEHSWTMLGSTWLKNNETKTLQNQRLPQLRLRWTKKHLHSFSYGCINNTQSGCQLIYGKRITDQYHFNMTGHIPCVPILHSYEEQRLGTSLKFRNRYISSYDDQGNVIVLIQL